MKSFIIVLAALALNSTSAWASVHKEVEVWCGAPTKSLTGFPYMTSIRTYKSKKHHGKQFEVATVYKNGHIVAKNYVFKTKEGMGMSYRSSDNDFNLNLSTQTALDGTAAFRAVVHEKDGDTMIANGEFPCHRPTKKS